MTDSPGSDPGSAMLVINAVLSEAMAPPPQGLQRASRGANSAVVVHLLPPFL